MHGFAVIKYVVIRTHGLKIQMGSDLCYPARKPPFALWRRRIFFVSLETEGFEQGGRKPQAFGRKQSGGLFSPTRATSAARR